MYCKHCGKPIEDDSAFCSHCGKKVDAMSLGESNKSTNDTQIADGGEKVSNDAMKSKETDSLHIKTLKRYANKKTIIANEIVGNLKMLGWAVALLVFYMLVFFIYHHKDRKEYDYRTSTSYFGESCYDPFVLTLTGPCILHWEEHYYRQLYYHMYKHEPIYLESPTPEECIQMVEELKKDLLLKQLLEKAENSSYCKKNNIPESTVYGAWNMIDTLEIKNQAKLDAERDIELYNDAINFNRKVGFEKDFKMHLLYASLILTTVFIFGRYFIKLAKWVNVNKKDC